MKKEYDQYSDIEYYYVGRRPLNDAKRKFPFGATASEKGNLRFEHWQFISPKGKNFGFGQNGVFEESVNDKNYSFDTLKHGEAKYNADCIDIARERVSKKWKQQVENVDKVEPFSGFPEKVAPLPWYMLLSHNCQDYVEEVLKEAEKVANEKKIPLIVESKIDAYKRTAKRTSGQYGEIMAEDWGKILYPHMN